MEKTDIAENYLTYGEDVMWDYVGEPFEYDGAGIFPPGLTNTANIYLRTQKTNYVAYNTMGVPFEDLLKLISDGIDEDYHVRVRMGVYPNADRLCRHPVKSRPRIRIL